MVKCKALMGSAAKGLTAPKPSITNESFTTGKTTAAYLEENKQSTSTVQFYGRSQAISPMPWSITHCILK